MLDFIDVKIVAGAQVAMAAGIIHFWIKWFRTEHNEPWLPSGYMEHERCFVYPDSVLSLLMIISAILLWAGNPSGDTLTLVCGGMMLFLAVIDTAYFIQNGMFARDKGGIEKIGLVLPTGIMSVSMIVRFI